jgi:hypothetical protein
VATPAREGDPGPVADFYKQCLAKARQAEQSGDTAAAVDWLRQAEFIGKMVLKQADVPEVSAGYARILVATCRSARSLAVRNGNITDQHAVMAMNISTLASRLRARLADKDATLAARAVVIEGLAARLVSGMLERRQKKPLYTPTEVLDTVLDSLTEIVGHAQQLGFKIEAPHGTSEELLDLARTAVSNARLSLSWFLSERLSDWEKAGFMCRRSMQLLSQHVTLEGASAGSSPELDRLYDQLTVAWAALARHDYKESRKLLKSAETALKARTATR